MEQVTPETGLSRRHTVAVLVAAWQQAEAALKTAHRLLAEAQAGFTEAFDGSSRYLHIDYKDLSCETPDRIIKALHRQAWEAIIEKTNIKKIMSLAKQKEVEDQLAKGELPEITEANVLAMLETQYNNLDQYAEQLVKEVYDWIRPRVHPSNGYWDRFNYKTNIKSAAVGLGEKVIIEHACERGYGQNRPWRINYHREANFTALDNVFHLLDGKGVVKSHHGPLFDAIAAAPREGRCETDYFRVWMFRNNNMHLQFKRKDLLERFNQVAGGMRLKDCPPIRRPASEPCQTEPQTPLLLGI